MKYFLTLGNSLNRLCSFQFKRYYAMVTVHPKNGLIDEVLQIKVTGLNETEKITILATSFGTKDKWQSHAHYKANKWGSVNTNNDPSHGGDYIGIEPMGLFWSLKLSPERFSNMAAKDFLKPYSILLEVFRGHYVEDDLQQQNSICSVAVKMSHLSESIMRVPVKHKNVRGTLFVPKNPGSYPGVIDIRGVPGVNEIRPSLLAAKGFVTLALAHSDYDDLPRDIDEFDLKYFKEAVDFLSNHEKVKNVGVLGSSLGGAIALAMSGCIPDIKCVVLICSPIFPLNQRFKFGERKWDRVKMDSTKITISNNTMNSAKVFPQMTGRDIEKSMPRFQDSKAGILSIEGKDDGLGHSAKKHNVLQDMFRESGKTNYKFVEYEGAGHLIDVPYLPLSAKAYFNKKQTSPTFFGGNPKEHAKAQEQAWLEIINFLQKTLNKDSSKL